MDLISVIVPVYNVENYLSKCIDSILAQTYTNLEIILVDDGSPDNCGKICDEYAKKDSRIKVIHQENGGLSAARNAGLDTATGDYIGFVDSDDYIEPDMYNCLHNSIINSKVKIACCGRFREITSNYSVKAFCCERATEFNIKEAFSEMLLQQRVDVSVCDKLFSRDLLYDIRFPVGEINEDVVVVFELIKKSNGIIHSGDVFYHYVSREDSICHSEYNEKKYVAIKHLNQIKDSFLSPYPSLEREFKIYSCLVVHSLILDVLSLKKGKSKYKEHLRDYYCIFNECFLITLFSKEVDLTTKIKIILCKLRTPRLFRALKWIYRKLAKNRKQSMG